MRRHVPAAVAAALLTAALAGPAAAAEPSLSVSGLRQEPGLVEFYVTAEDLTADAAAQLAVAADGRDLPTAVERLSAVANSAPRRAVVLVLDTSGSMAGGPLTAARTAAQRYVESVPADVEIGVVRAGAPAAVVVAPTRDRSEVTGAVNGLAAKGETALYDGVALAGGLMGKGAWGQRRIVALSDGADTASKASLADARQAAGKIPVDTIAFRTSDGSGEELAGLATGTGGQAYTAADAAALSRAFTAASGSFTAQLLVRVTVPAELSGQQVRLAISAGAARTEVPVTLAVDTGATVPLTGTPGGLPGTTWLLVVGGLVFAGLLAAGLLLMSPVLSASDRRKRLAQVDQFVAKRRGPAPVEGGQVAAAALALSEQVVRTTNVEGRLAAQLDRAGMRMRPHEWLLLRALACLTLGLLLGVALSPLAGLLLGPVLGWLLTWLYLYNRTTKRVNAFRELLPDALQLIVGSLRSGFSLAQAVDAMARELPEPISAEFGRALGETRLGMDLEDALDRLATRMRSKDLAWTVVAVRVQREVGGNLAEVLATTIESMRERETLYREVRSLSAEGRLSAWVLLAMPIGVGAFMAFFRTAYVEPLYTKPVGLVMTAVAVLLVLGGGFWMSRLIKIEV
ncbi:type II secretion system F family protein [Catellatospora sp. NPDC049609]|uniref:type II secretion system F family protein n=1 Tax=Catellatospora sp. NPDC049609 TaxID=3155505 RepID=UPI0034421E9B